MKKLIIILTIFYCSANSFGQSGELIENKVIKFSIEQGSDNVEFIVVDTLLNKKKPVFLWCQGSLPVPLFCEVENHGNYFFGGGISNFNYTEIAKQYHLVIISMPKTPIVVKKDIPIYLAYGTEDRTADLCDLMPLFFIEQGKKNLTLKRYIGLEHNFFEVNEDGNANHEKGHWRKVMDEFINWL